MNLFKRRSKEDGFEYDVKVDGFRGGEYDLIFDKKNDARAYKKAIAQSNRKLHGRIISREYTDGFILEEKEVN